ncbi:MAG: hypothetical protein WBA74_01775, partial [Cyclobacteriaceae bacterium]
TYIASLNGRLLLADEGGYTCTSKCSGGCDVVKLGKDIGCNACPENSTEKCIGQSSKSSYSTIGEGKGGGFVDLSGDIAFVQVGEESVNDYTLPDWDVMMQHPAISAKFEKFVNDLWGGKEIQQKSAELALVNVYGTYIRLYVPSNLKEAKPALRTVAGDEVTCSCSSEQNGCDHEDITIGKGLLSKKVGDKCVAGDCTSCTMSW